MAPVYADHPYKLIETPEYKLRQEGKEFDIFDHCASEMALVHNIISRALNSVYLQAPHIQPKDQRAFLRYIDTMLLAIHIHHSGEEEELFPDMEKMAGEKGIMEENIAQHHAFHDGLHAFEAYIKDCIAGKEPYDAAKIISMMDAFGKTLTDHLADEIPTLAALKRFGAEKFSGLQKRFDLEGETNMKAMGSQGICVLFANFDLEYEGGIWRNFPEAAPRLVMWLHRTIMWWWNSDILKFGACDRLGRMQPLYAVPSEDKSS